jgi:hypothetical protein
MNNLLFLWEPGFLPRAEVLCLLYHIDPECDKEKYTRKIRFSQVHFLFR